MKLNPCTISSEPNQEPVGRRRKEQAAVRIDREIKSVLDELHYDEACRLAFLCLLACVRSRTALLKPTPGCGNPGWPAPVFLVHRLKNLAAQQRHWIRSCESWRPEGVSLRSVFRSLARHLLTQFSVPGFMDSAWDLALGAEGFRQQSWYIRLGRGSSLRSLNLPMVLTRNMEHHVRQAPDHLTIAQALRYGETRGLGGSERLALEVALGRLGQRIEHPEFWGTVLDFFAAHPGMDLAHVNPIIDFIHANKFAGEEVPTETGAEIRTAPRPDFSMKGRTLKSVLRLVTAWHAGLSSGHSGPRLSWRRSCIQGYRFLEKRPEEDADRDWTIHELLDSGTLHAEGRALQHCVYTYAKRCQRGETTIWSLRLQIGDQEKRMVTIEVDPRRRAIVQARAKRNLRPGGRSLEIIRQWASWAGLDLDLQV